MYAGEAGAPKGGGGQTAKRRGGRTGTASPGDASGRHERNSRETARKRRRFIPWTAHRDVAGGPRGNCGSTPWGARGKGRGRSFLDTCCNSSEMGPRVNDAGDNRGRADCGGHGLDPHNRCPGAQASCQERGGSRVPIWSVPRSGKKGVGEPGGRPMVALMSLSWFAFLRVGEAASIRVADIRGEKALGFRATKRGIIGRRWRRWSEW